MSDDIKAAEQRAFLVGENHGFDIPDLTRDYTYWRANYLANGSLEQKGKADITAHRIARACLADLAAREAAEAERALPISEDWLRECGWRFSLDTGECRVYLGPATRQRSMEAHVYHLEGGLMIHVGPMCIPDMTTRGQLLDLLAALGIQPTKGGT